MKKSTAALLVASKEIGLEISTDKTKYMSRDKNARRSDKIKFNNSYFESAKQFKYEYLGTTQTNKNFIQEELKGKMKSGILAVIRCTIFCLPVCYPIYEGFKKYITIILRGNLG